MKKLDSPPFWAVFRSPLKEHANMKNQEHCGHNKGYGRTRQPSTPSIVSLPVFDRFFSDVVQRSATHICLRPF